MSYLALYRKYRPKTFDEVIGQKHITQTLINQIKNDKVGHAYLLCGSRGTGKTSTAKIFAKAINCEHPINGSPCEKCATCKALSENNLDILEIDAASNNKVDEIRDLREKVKYPPLNGKYKVYIVDEVHMLTDSAFNALLKTLEEPPAYVVFILATTEVHKLPATILSRCMRFDFKLVSTTELETLLRKILNENKIAFEEDAIKLISRAGEGSVRDTLSIADMCISYAGETLTYKSVVDVLGSTEKENLSKIAEAILSGNIGSAMVELDNVLCDGKSSLILSKDIIEYFRDLLVLSTMTEKAKELVVAEPQIMEIMKAQASIQNYTKIVQIVELLSSIEAELRYSSHPRIVLEANIVKAMNANSILKRIERIEKIIESGDSKN
ncbi:MAG: DNA polymerase III subunit gamma/tau [Clostridia bacterium]